MIFGDLVDCRFVMRRIACVGRSSHCVSRSSESAPVDAQCNSLDDGSDLLKVDGRLRPGGGVAERFAWGVAGSERFAKARSFSLGCAVGLIEGGPGPRKAQVGLWHSKSISPIDGPNGGVDKTKIPLSTPRAFAKTLRPGHPAARPAALHQDYLIRWTSARQFLHDHCRDGGIPSTGFPALQSSASFFAASATIRL